MRAKFPVTGNRAETPFGWNNPLNRAAFAPKTFLCMRTENRRKIIFIIILWAGYYFYNFYNLSKRPKFSRKYHFWAQGGTKSSRGCPKAGSIRSMDTWRRLRQLRGALRASLMLPGPHFGQKFWNLAVPPVFGTCWDPQLPNIDQKIPLFGPRWPWIACVSLQSGSKSKHGHMEEFPMGFRRAAGVFGVLRTTFLRKFLGFWAVAGI